MVNLLRLLNRVPSGLGTLLSPKAKLIPNTPFLLPTRQPKVFLSSKAHGQARHIPPPSGSLTPSLLSLPLVSSTTLNPAANVGKWLLGTSAFISTIVAVGGVTRLTKSGLSMTTWSALGGRPPKDEQEWMEEFELYKSSPEFGQRESMDLDEFKNIYYWEWGHRMLGRCAGVIFVVPFTYFAARGRIPKGYYPRMLTLLGLGGTQGLIGWWMVKSGLGDDRRGDHKEIRVSPYRLAVHLSTAFLTYSVCLWTGLDLLHPKEAMVAAGETLRKTSQSALPKLKNLRVGAIGTTALVATTVVSGAFVAGNDAGNAYNDWPYMNGQWVPSDIIDPTLKDAWRNIFESTGMVQFDHRMLAYFSTAAVAGLYAYAMNLKAYLTPQSSRSLTFMGLALTTQVTLGVTTLMLYVPVPLAACHQLGSLALLSSGLYAVHSLRYVGVAVGRRGAAKAVSDGAAAAKRLIKN